MKKILVAFFIAALGISGQARVINLVQNPGFETVSGTSQTSGTGTTKNPDSYTLKGAAYCGYLGGKMDFATHGIIFPGTARNGGSVGQLIQNIDQSKGRWITFRFRGLAESGFVMNDNSLEMKIEFFSKNGADYLDCASGQIYQQIETDRKNLNVNGDYHRYGAAVWRTYEVEELIPFPEVDAVRISVSYKDGAANSPNYTSFLIDDFSLVQRDYSLTGKVDPVARIRTPQMNNAPDIKKMISLGGRWYYQSSAGETVDIAKNPLTVTAENADRLFYKSDRLINPFLDNVTAWLRAGYKDEKGNIVTKDQFVPDNVVLTFKGDGFLTLTTKNLPNHPTAKFPGFNPNYIREMTRTYRIPLNPVINPNAVAMTANDSNHALPMGPIGVAVNGVVFFNPFDAGMGDARNIMDYCCGHPNFDGQYHYHKYPICVNTPFVDKGAAPSPVIGFAFDGFPIYGPYQSAGVMAKDSTTNPLNAFNACNDAVRGWHYNVTPGKFPYLLGGYFGKPEASDFARYGMRRPLGGTSETNRSTPPF